MLPTTKLFKTIECPYFNGAPDSCIRPYCHYNHVKPVVTSPPAIGPQASPSIPVYIPTPKHILEAQKQANGSQAKKMRMEYQPEAPAIIPFPSPSFGYSSATQRKIAKTTTTTTTTTTEASASNTNGTTTNEHAPDSNENTQQQANYDDISGLINDLASDSMDDEQTNNNDNTEENTQELDKHIDTNAKERSEKHKSSSSSKSSSRSSKSSSSSSSRSKHKSSHAEKSSSSHHRSSHSEKSSSSSSSRHRSSHHSKSSHSDREKRHGSSRSHRRSSESSSSSSRHRSSSDVKESAEMSICYQTDSDEDDVEAQCRMIFEEFEATTTPDDRSNEKIKRTKIREHTTSKPTDSEKATKSSAIDTTLPKKRVAHDNVNNQPKSVPARQPAKNHMQSAMQSIHLRQEIARKQQEEALAKQREAEAEAEAEEERKALELSLTAHLTPLMPALARQPPPRGPPRTFTPVSNLLAIERAKAKVQELRAEKLAQQQLFRPSPSVVKTIAQTSQKGNARVAHTNQVPKSDRAAPPILEASATKISYNVRTQYYNMMVKHCQTIYDDCNDAWERAQTEELAVFKKCSTTNIYKSSALLAINKLRKESLEAGNVNTEKNKVESHDMILAGKHALNTSWNVNRKLNSTGPPENIIDTLPSTKAYSLIADLCLTDELLKENGYPRPTSRSGIARIHKNQAAAPTNKSERYCRRCGKVFKLEEYDEVCVDRCNYHPKSPGYRRGFADHAHRCCQQPSGTPGCMYADYHVTDYIDVNHMVGFVQTMTTDEGYVPTRKDIFALDCEMCYTTVGLELTRVTVVDINKTVVYDALVRPENRIVDYNTTYSGISEATLANVTRTIRDVQKMFRSMFNSDTVLIGHSLESDLKALKLIHNRVVDTSVLYPHKMGPPKKRALKTLCIENLKRIIQEDEGGHNSAEDAEVCIDLVKHYLRNRIN